MKEVLGCIFRMDFLTHLTGWFTIVCAAILLIWHRVLVKKDKDNKTWKTWSIMCFVPAVMCAVHLYFNWFKGHASFSLELYLPMYAGALALIVLSFLRNKKLLYKIASVLTVAAAFMGFGYAVFIRLADHNLPHIANYSRCGYVESFDKIMSDMKKNYVMNDWKGIDYDQIRAEIMPKLEEAEKNHDPKAFYKALLEYVRYFHDGHMELAGFSAEGATYAGEAEDELAGNDYGFALITVDSGETIAILVEKGSAAEKAGINSGTVITKWNGVDIDKAIEEAEYTLGSEAPVKANFDMVKAMYFPGLSKGTVEVSFIGPDSGEKTVSLDSIGNYSKRLSSALGKFNHRGLAANFDIEEFKKLPREEQLAFYERLKAERENYTSEMISKDCGIIVFNSESFNLVGDVIADIKGEYPKVKELVNSRLEDLQSKGMKHLIIDARNNAGGYPIITCELVSLFTDHEIVIDNDGTSRSTVKVDGRWKDLDVIVLTNMNCCSSGDGLIYALLQCPNVTVMGMTGSMGIYQSVGGACITPNSEFILRYPLIPSYGADGLPVIDTGPDRVSRIPIDVKIPVTKKACETIFNGEDDADYELEYALAYIDNKQRNLK